MIIHVERYALVVMLHVILLWELQGHDCYLFHVSPEMVIDTTTRGSAVRFTNHCCMPSMYSRVSVRSMCKCEKHVQV